MMPASTNGGGQCVTTGPIDVCKTPSPGGPIPLPYPNMAQNTQASGGSCSSKVKIDGKKTIINASEISMSSGDEPGSAGGGVVSNGIKGKVTFKMVSNTVKAEGKGIGYIGSMTAHNGSNANAPAGAQVAPSQTKVLIMP